MYISNDENELSDTVHRHCCQISFSKKYNSGQMTCCIFPGISKSLNCSGSEA